jgi:hypothetical protein
MRRGLSKLPLLLPIQPSMLHMLSQLPSRIGSRCACNPGTISVCG